eukprot:gnl/MRDRNA2_/MRDRNA2_316435_c0_seq1.p1 gnl/MRDRNA2_/MRDRNA2_316435_c0~~gnl/MRDRNA2_/MRDRNA2_316435_c0_seq1.p1  ORF type:complete len:128 (-),score=26.46 gnl/MRDRNA2_/MRDRNA2_316435_c0_seq1:124-507(-)
MAGSQANGRQHALLQPNTFDVPCRIDPPILNPPPPMQQLCVESRALYMKQPEGVMSQAANESMLPTMSVQPQRLVGQRPPTVDDLESPDDMAQLEAAKLSALTNSRNFSFGDPNQPLLFRPYSFGDA